MMSKFAGIATTSAGRLVCIVHLRVILMRAGVLRYGDLTGSLRWGDYSIYILWCMKLYGLRMARLAGQTNSGDLVYQMILPGFEALVIPPNGMVE